MPTPLDLLPTLDAAAQPFVAALASVGPVYMQSDKGWIWLLTTDKREFLGFRATAVPPATYFQAAPVSVPVIAPVTPPATTTPAS